MNVSTQCNSGRYELDTADGITPDAEEVFTRGQCHALALALHEALPGSKCVGIDWESYWNAGTPDHVLVKLEDGRFLDVLGIYEDTGALGMQWGHCDAQPVDVDDILAAMPDEDGDPCYWEPDLDAARAYAPLVIAEYLS